MASRLTAVQAETGAGGLFGFVQRPFLPLYLAAFSVLYFLAAKLGIATSLPPEGIVTIGPPNAIVLAALLTVDRKHWWAVFLATLGTEIFADLPHYPLWAAAGYGAVNFFEAATAAFLLQRLGGGIPPIGGVGDFVRFVAVGPVLASGLAALFGAAIYKIGAPEVEYLHYWRVFWFGDALGLLVVGTCLLSFLRVPIWWREAGQARALEAVALAIGLAAAIGWAFYSGPNIPRVYVVFPFLLWAAVRFGSHGACLAVLATIASAIASASTGEGPFAFLKAIDRVPSLQTLSAIVALSTFFLAFTIEDFWRVTARLRAEVDEHGATAAQLALARDELERRNSELDDIVAERTDELQHTVARNEVLLQEIYHRVKNSLQMVSGMISLQGRTGSARDLSAKVTTQIGAISATYDIMHRAGAIESADLFPVVSELCAKISDTAGGSITLTCDIDGSAAVPAGTAVPFILVFNELITNAIKHSDAEDAVVHVRCRREGSDAVFRVADNGPGFPAGFEVAKARGFGMRMAQRVVSQAGGTIQLGSTSKGATVEVRLPLPSGGSAASA